MTKSLNILFAVAIALVCTCSANAQIQSNLVNNAGFEDPLGFDFSDTSNWNGFFGGPPGTILEAFNDTGATPRSGSLALELTLDGDAGAGVNGFEAFVGHVQTVAIGGDEDFVFSTFARNNSSALTGVTEIRIEFRQGGTELSRTQIDVESLLTDSFEEFSIEGTTPTDTDNVNLVFALTSFNQDVLHSNSVVFDDVSFGIAAIPEPSGVLFATMGLAGLVLRRRRS